MHKQDVADDGQYAQTVLDGGFQVMLPAAVKLFPTPRASDANGTGFHGQGGMDLRTHITMWLTPSANEDAAGTTTGKMQQMLTHQAKASDPEGTAHGGQLNPDWVELLMGWPRGWSALTPLDPALFAEWRDAFRTGRGQRAWQDGSWEAGVPRVAVKPPHRVPRLTAIGNGQVPAALVRAVQVLAFSPATP